MTAADTTTARETVDLVSGAIARLAARFIAQGASRDDAVQVATDHYLGRLAAERPSAFTTYMNALGTLTDAA